MSIAADDVELFPISFETKVSMICELIEIMKSEGVMPARLEALPFSNHAGVVYDVPGGSHVAIVMDYMRITEIDVRTSTRASIDRFEACYSIWIWGPCDDTTLKLLQTTSAWLTSLNILATIEEAKAHIAGGGR